MKKYNLFASVAVIVAILNVGQAAPTSGNYTAAFLAIVAALICLMAGQKAANEKNA